MRLKIHKQYLYSYYCIVKQNLKNRVSTVNNRILSLIEQQTSNNSYNNWTCCYKVFETISLPANSAKLDLGGGARRCVSQGFRSQLFLGLKQTFQSLPELWPLAIAGNFPIG